MVISDNVATNAVILFLSIHDVLQAEQILQKENIWYDMIPVPKEVDSSCGMALEVRLSDIAKIHAKLQNNALVRIRAYYQKNPWLPLMGIV